MNFEDLSEQEILQVANPIMDNLMDASTKIDHERHVKDFTDRMKSIVSKDYLQKVCEQYQSEKGFLHRESWCLYSSGMTLRQLSGNKLSPRLKAILSRRWFWFTTTGNFSATM
jgi:hypothetical protein